MDGIDLVLARVAGINQRGHFGLPVQAASVVPLLASIFGALGGDEVVLAGKRTTPLQGDFLHVGSSVMVEWTRCSTSPLPG